MGMGDRILRISEKVADAIDASPQEQRELEWLLKNDPQEFAAKYREHLSEEDIRLLGGNAPG